MSSRRLVALLLVALGLAGTGCGGDGKAKNAYVDEVQQAQRSFVASFDGAKARLTPTSTLAEDRSTLRSFAAAAMRFAAQLRRASPPSAVRDEHARLVRVVERYQAAVYRAAGKLTGADRAERVKVRTELSSSVSDTQAKLTEAIGQINQGLRG